MMDVKTYLRQLARMDQKIDALLERRERYEALAAKRTTMITGMPGSRRRESNVEYFGCKLVDLARNIDRRIDEYVDLTRQIESEIDALPDDRYRDILRFRYINRWSWNRILDAMNYTDMKWLWHLHGEALKALKFTPRNTTT